ncbi:MAG: peptide chain release factor-like protein, partial [Spirochaetes bacterium]|nr:peptide chain release factor-like protein [Spirochaetota bacterium]
MIDFGASPGKQKKLRERMDQLKIREDDLEEKFIRSGGKGGQNVNK